MYPKNIKHQHIVKTFVLVNSQKHGTVVPSSNLRNLKKSMKQDRMTYYLKQSGSCITLLHILRQ